MVIDLTGILDDGSDRSQQLPSGLRRALEVPVGISATIRLNGVSVGNVPLKLTSGTVLFTLKQTFLDQTPLLKIAGTAVSTEGPSRINFSILPANTKPIAPGRYVYDVRWVNGSSQDLLVPLSQFSLLPAVSLP